MKIQMIAALLVDESGSAAADAARSRHSELSAAGDWAGATVWAQVLTTVEELLGAGRGIVTLH